MITPIWQYIIIIIIIIIIKSVYFTEITQLPA
jgi:hypothetical protein